MISVVFLVCIAFVSATGADDTTTATDRYRSREIVVTATRSPIERSHSPVLVSSISSQFLRTIGLPGVGGALCYVPSVRVEVNCQTCNYSQVRINGLAGNYTQILVNGRPIVSPLVSLYGLDQIPSAMVERIEILRGSASVLYGSSAIAGVVNLVTRDRWEESSAVSLSAATIGGAALETMANASVLVGNDDASASLAVNAHHRTRDGFDLNGDGFTELARLRNVAFGVDASIGDSNHVLRATGAVINEERRGGNRLDQPPDRAEQAEYRNQDMAFATASYVVRSDDRRYELFGALNATRRVHYTGVDRADGWGKTRSVSGIVGAQVSQELSGVPILRSVQFGVEYQFENTRDAVEAYGYNIAQRIGQGGVFLEASGQVSQALTMVAGLRTAWHSALAGAIVIGRAALLWRPDIAWELRLNWGDGFRAPQAFETDMHIAFASGGVSLVRIDPALQIERARSWSLSVTHRFQHDDLFVQASADGFATVFENPFVLEDDGIDSRGNRILRRTNGASARVFGISGEIQLRWRKFELMATLTAQRSVHTLPVAWSEDLPPERRFLRTPDLYGSATLRMPLSERIEALATAVFTGSMLVPYMGLSGDRLVRTPPMLDCSAIVRWRLVDDFRGAGQLLVGVELRNIFDAYQRDFDLGPYRDSNYIWGPPQPRTIGLRLEWLLE